MGDDSVGVAGGLSFFNLIRNGYDELVNGICRPPRARYDIAQLGPPVLKSGKWVFERTDLQVKNKRGHTLQCSWWEPIASQRAHETLPVVIYMHGNCGCRLDALDALEHVLAVGLTLFTFDFSGSGMSEGEFISLGWFERDDLDAVVTYLRGTGKVSSIGLWGRSMGAATALMHGERDPSIGGMVLDSPFASLKQLSYEIVDMSNFKVPRLAVAGVQKMLRSTIEKKADFDINMLEPISFVDKSFIPALFATATGDTFVQPHHCDQLHAAYAGEKNKITFEGDHNSLRPTFFFDSAAIFLHNTLCINSGCPSGASVDGGLHFAACARDWHRLLSAERSRPTTDLRASEPDLIQEIAARQQDEERPRRLEARPEVEEQRVRPSTTPHDQPHRRRSRPSTTTSSSSTTTPSTTTPTTSTSATASSSRLRPPTSATTSHHAHYRARSESGSGSTPGGSGEDVDPMDDDGSKSAFARVQRRGKREPRLEIKKSTGGTALSSPSPDYYFAEDGAWVCETCTFENLDATFLDCAVCNTPRPLQPQPPAATTPASAPPSLSSSGVAAASAEEGRLPALSLSSLSRGISGRSPRSPSRSPRSPSQHSPSPPPRRVTEPPAVQREFAREAVHLPILPRQVDLPDPSTLSMPEAAWNCPMCTFLNEPETGPTCDICGAACPACLPTGGGGGGGGGESVPVLSTAPAGTQMHLFSDL